MKAKAFIKMIEEIESRHPDTNFMLRVGPDVFADAFEAFIAGISMESGENRKLAVIEPSTRQTDQHHISGIDAARAASPIKSISNGTIN